MSIVAKGGPFLRKDMPFVSKERPFLGEDLSIGSTARPLLRKNTSKVRADLSNGPGW